MPTSQDITFTAPDGEVPALLVTPDGGSGAGHAFDNHRNPMFANPDAAAAAWARTSAFLAAALKR